MICPRCGNNLVAKNGKYGPFIGCSNYPNCDFASWDKPLDKNCELCGSYLVEHKFGRTKKIYCSNENCEKSAPKTPKKETKKTSKKAKSDK